MANDALLSELETRGLLSACTDEGALGARLRRGPVRCYVGFDPTAASLHVGSLMPLAVQRLVQRHGHVPVLLVGGATGMIGDPSGRSQERNMLDAEELDRNRAALRAQMERLLPSASGDTLVVDNRDWLADLSLLEFLRDVGRHASINVMLGRDSVKLRRESDAGLSFTEFTYQLLQAFDFWWLRTHLEVELQIGGTDQWGNITAGLDLMRRRGSGPGWGLVWPLLTKADGSKFGKTASGNVWLDAGLTSVFAFWQFWFNTTDADLETMLLRFCGEPVEVIRHTLERQRADPAGRLGQRLLANDVTTWVHGAAAARNAERAAGALFGSELIDGEVLAMIEREIDGVRLPRGEIVGRPIVELAVRAGLCRSLNAARRLAAGGGLHVGDVAVAPGATIVEAHFGGTDALLLRQGRKQWRLVLAV
jgi:tyrosyl-tRNA synthetase